MSQVNLLQLCADRTNFQSSLLTLEKLAASKEGPLRIEFKKNIPYLGIRTWKTFFFEKLVLDDLDIPDIEKNTAETIESYVGTFVATIQKQPKRPSASNALAVQTTSDLSYLASKVFFKLQAKALGKDLNPQLRTVAWMAATMTQPGYRNEKLDSGTVKSHNGKVIVPKGLSIGIIPIWNVVADVRFVASEFMTLADSYGRSQSISMDTEKHSNDPSEFEENDYFLLYKHNLEQISESETSVAMQLVNDHSAGSSEANTEGAWRAADEFMKKRAAGGSPVSVLLCTKNLPKVETKPNARLSWFQRQWPPIPNSDSDSDSDSDYIV